MLFREENVYSRRIYCLTSYNFYSNISLLKLQKYNKKALQDNLQGF